LTGTVPAPDRPVPGRAPAPQAGYFACAVPYSDRSWARRPRRPRAASARNRQPDPHGFLGPWALSLTALSPVLEDYGGGPGRIAIHGRDGASLRDPLGTARSHGCVRVSDRAVRWLARRIPPGAPVEIRD
jgi:lipoprotein-anchoring transpeptidase ErfK/SrfK